MKCECCEQCLKKVMMSSMCLPTGSSISTYYLSEYLIILSCYASYSFSEFHPTSMFFHLLTYTNEINIVASAIKSCIKWCLNKWLPEITDFGFLQQSQNRARFWICTVLNRLYLCQNWPCPQYYNSLRSAHWKFYKNMMINL